MLPAHVIAQPLDHLFTPSFIQQIFPKPLAKRVLCATCDWPTAPPQLDLLQLSAVLNPVIPTDECARRGNWSFKTEHFATPYTVCLKRPHHAGKAWKVSKATLDNVNALNWKDKHQDEPIWWVLRESFKTSTRQNEARTSFLVWNTQNSQPEYFWRSLTQPILDSPHGCVQMWKYRKITYSHTVLPLIHGVSFHSLLAVISRGPQAGYPPSSSSQKVKSSLIHCQ